MKKRRTLKRERINRELTNIFKYPLTIVEAPMGYGKTTAVSEFLALKGVPVIWTSFLSEEDTAHGFWERLAAEIGKFDKAAESRLKSLGVPADTPQTTMAVSIINEMGYKPDTTLVIDDFHLARSMRVTALFRRFVMEMPDDFHIVILTRDTTNLDITELSAKGLCYIVSQNMLRFTDSEIRDYCALMGFTASEGEIRKIGDYTGGWISLIYLIMLGMERGIPVGRNGTINELVEKVLYNAYDERIQRFLLCLSVMDSFTAEQAVFVTQEEKSEETLKKLRRENAFIAFDEAAGVYIIHNVLLDFLRGKQKDEEERAALYRRLGEWYLAQRKYRTAYGYLYRAGESERILALLDNGDTITSDSATFDGALDLFAAMPREMLHKYPLAYLQYIAIILTNGDPDDFQDGVIRLNELREACERAEDPVPHGRDRVLAELYLTQIFAVFNDAKEMAACIEKAQRLLDGDVSFLQKREAEFTLGSPHLLYTCYREPGSLKELTELMASDFPIFAELADGCSTGCDYVVRAEYALETGNWQAAELDAFKGIYKAQTKEQIGLVICAYFVLIRLYLYKGKTNEALELLRQLRQDVKRTNNLYYNTGLEIVEGYVYGCLTRLNSIPLWLQTGDMSPAQFFYEGLGFKYIVYGKALLLSKNYIKLEMLTEEFARCFAVFHNQLGFLHNQIFRATAKYPLYGMEVGCAALREAFSMAREDHIILPFAEYAPAVIDMVRHIAHADSRDAYIKKVLEACVHYMESLKHSIQSAVSLSARELEILTLAAEGLKRDEIAGKLHVTAGTVQTHLHNIYLKLEVSGRMAAIKKAQKLKLL
ncbi:MAG TPA: LuxR C-terminal-related transcriptional regulator [Bacillota bacterium]|nr:LuxR C-terminal-related transcriptional regulator [Bacillota bacterium]HPX67936.1 LuxR C-terminal-related transcriptional regulator [Bacillota bacterium]HQO42540.1 LuxR C-terminal-related transcriptional regulator [Bacillota bacterium]HQQ45186.1 LuxR C-terminal-related transcriptional regulator [Bacillota bacterium]